MAYQNNEDGEYKERLFQTMEDIGLVDNVRLQIRQKLLDKLKHPPRTKEVKPDQMLVKRICASLVVDYLSMNNHNYSLSVFQPECGYSNALLPSTQLFGMLKAIPADNSVLQVLVQANLPKRIRQSPVSTSQQTDDANSVESIERRLNNIEANYKGSTPNYQMLKMMEGREEREVKFKNQLTKRFKQDMEKEIRRVREFQIMNVRLEERERYNMVSKEYKSEIDVQYKERLDKLRDREEEVMKRVTDKIKDLESHSFDQRQKTLKDMEYLKLKERQLELFKQSLEARETLLQKQLKK